MRLPGHFTEWPNPEGRDFLSTGSFLGPVHRDAVIRCSSSPSRAVVVASGSRSITRSAHVDLPLDLGWAALRVEWRWVFTIPDFAIRTELAPQARGRQCRLDRDRIATALVSLVSGALSRSGRTRSAPRSRRRDECRRGDRCRRPLGPACCDCRYAGSCLTVSTSACVGFSAMSFSSAILDLFRGWPCK